MVFGAKSSIARSLTLLRWLTARNGPAGHLREASLVIGLCLVYAAVSSLPKDGIEHLARVNAERLIAFESSLGFFWETAWNRWLVGAGDGIATAFNWVYILTFLAVIPLAALVYYVAARGRYLHYRNVVVMSLLFALAAHAVFPVAPPRMMAEYGFVDTMNSFGPGWYDMRDVVYYFNAYAAMPSLHFAWAVFFGVLFIRQRSKLLKAVGVLYPLITLAAIVATANHYLMDAVAGALLMALACWIYEAIRRAGVFAKWGTFLLKRPLRYPQGFPPFHPNHPHPSDRLRVSGGMRGGVEGDGSGRFASRPDGGGGGSSPRREGGWWGGVA